MGQAAELLDELGEGCLRRPVEWSCRPGAIRQRLDVFGGAAQCLDPPLGRGVELVPVELAQHQRDGGAEADGSGAQAALVDVERDPEHQLLALEHRRVIANGSAAQIRWAAIVRLRIARPSSILPIVIRNAGEHLCRGSKVMRPGVIDVHVMEPVSVQGWTSETMEEGIAGVRRQFVETLADWPRRASLNRPAVVGTVTAPG